MRRDVTESSCKEEGRAYVRFCGARRREGTHAEAQRRRDAEVFEFALRKLSVIRRTEREGNEKLAPERPGFEFKSLS